MIFDSQKALVGLIEGLVNFTKGFFYPDKPARSSSHKQEAILFSWNVNPSTSFVWSSATQC
eukprot:TRINITY_DN9953_c0_g1_i1.p2 TRINITY_DN9953_c0_g1~~TRINITY_DN9953_c0_g1_i1.p2  ORF type:complete len:61 (+),score=1.54 TRINITY_DN9953_c0_g1_i1:188-370(+)